MNHKSEKYVGKIVTHDGKFHADEVLATSILLTIYPAASLTRTRDRNVIQTADIAVDVGHGEYDHHQAGGNGARYVDTLKMQIPYSSAGLIWRDYGRDYISVVLGNWLWDGWRNWIKENYGISHDLTCPDAYSDYIEKIWRMIDSNFIAIVDGVDNGISVSNGPISFSAMIGLMNPKWHEFEEDRSDSAFYKAKYVAEQVLYGYIQMYLSQLLAEGAIANAMASQANAEAEDRHILVLDKAIAWQMAVHDLDVEKRLLYVVYPSDYGWKLQCVPIDPAKFGSRKLMPEHWAGLRDAALAEKTGIADATFCHNGRWIAGATTKESAIQMARHAVAS